MDRELGGRSKDQDPQQVPTLHGAGHGQGQRVERVDGEGVHVLALQGILRKGLSEAIEGSEFSLSLSESPFLFKVLYDHLVRPPRLQITIPRKEVSAFDAIPALGALGIATLLIMDYCSHGYLLLLKLLSW